MTRFMFIPNIPKLSQTVWELWPAQEFSFRGHRYDEENESCISCMRHAYWSLSMLLPNIIKIFQTIKTLWRAQEFGLEICLFMGGN